MNLLLGFISTVFGVIALICLITFILALLNVKSVLKNNPKKGTAIVIFVLFLLFAGLSGATEPKPQAQQNKPNNSIVAEKVNTTTSTQTPEPTKAPIFPTQTATPTQIPTNRITLDSLALTLIIFKPTQYGDRYIGYTSDGQNNITLIGSQDNITSINLNLNHIDKSTFSPTDITSLISGLAHQAVPEWTDANTWLENTLTSISSSTDPTPSYQTIVGNKTITLSLDTTTNDESFSIVEANK